MAIRLASSGGSKLSFIMLTKAFDEHSVITSLYSSSSKSQHDLDALGFGGLNGRLILFLSGTFLFSSSPSESMAKPSRVAHLERDFSILIEDIEICLE